MIKGKFETYPHEIHLLWKKVYYLHGKYAPENHQDWWPNSSLVEPILSNGIFNSAGTEQDSAFGTYCQWGILEYTNNYFCISDKYIDFLSTI